MASYNSNQLNVPEAREAMDRFKMECANDEGVQSHIQKLKTQILCGFQGYQKLAKLVFKHIKQ